MGNVIELEKYRTKSLRIRCPTCKRIQKMRYYKPDDIWFPVAPFCCAIMRNADTDEWNHLLDKEIQKAL